jgi:mono/diheme cytochrome c family protein
MLSFLPLIVAAVAAANPTAAEPVTYTRHIAPLLWKNCAGCHRPGEVGPFSLLTYQDAAKRADFLASITAERRMPPWKAAPDFGKFHGERRLADDEIALLAAWAAAGAPVGNAADLPTPPQFVEGWTLGQPDLVLEMAEPFTVPADGRDVYRCFVIPIPLDESKTVAAVEFRPGNRRVVHHALLFLDANGAARKKDEAEAGPGYNSFGGPGILPTGGLGGWAPGSMPRRLPEGTGGFLRRGSDLVMQLHYHPSGKAETDRSSVGIYFTKEPATKLIGGLAVRSRSLNIPAGEQRHQVTAESEPLPVPVNVLSVAPHMHLLGRQMKVTAKTPTGELVPLVWIPDWDFNWQGGYAFVEPVRLPAGSVVQLEAEYDNSADNPNNPSTPPKSVRWGEQTTDEMCLLGVQVTTDSLADLRQVVRLNSARLGGALVGGLDASDLDGLEGKRGRGDVERDRADALIDFVLSTGFDLPASAPERMKAYDTDNDGRISKAEFEAIPSFIQQVIREAIREKTRAIVDQPARE